MDRFSQTHVVGQDRPPGTDGESNAVQLVGQQVSVEELGAQRMLPRVLANLGYGGLDAVPKKLLVDVLLGVWVDGHVMAQRRQLPRALEQVVNIPDHAILERADESRDRVVELGRQEQPQFQLFPIAQMDRQVLATVGTFAHGGGEPTLGLLLHVQDVLADAERVLAKVRTRAIGFPGLPAAQGHPIGLPRFGIGHHVIGPEPTGLR